MIVKSACKCLYCGLKWVEEESTYKWNMIMRKCKHCGETKNLEVKTYQETTNDVYGYRFSPPFSK